NIIGLVRHSALTEHDPEALTARTQQMGVVRTARAAGAQGLAIDRQDLEWEWRVIRRGMDERLGGPITEAPFEGGTVNSPEQARDGGLARPLGMGEAEATTPATPLAPGTAAAHEPILS